MKKEITLTDTWINPETKEESEISVQAIVITEQEEQLRNLGIDPHYIDFAMKKQIDLIKENKNKRYQK